LSTDWRPLAEVAADDSGHISYDDREIADTGSRAYTYRLGIMQCGQEYFFGQVWLDVPYVGRVPRRVEKGSGVISRLLSTSRPEGRRTGGLRRARTYQG